MSENRLDIHTASRTSRGVGGGGTSQHRILYIRATTRVRFRATARVRFRVRARVRVRVRLGQGLGQGLETALLLDHIIILLLVRIAIPNAHM